MLLFGIAAALAGPRKAVWGTLAVAAMIAALVWIWNTAMPAQAVTPLMLLATGSVLSIVAGLPIAFALAFSALLYFLADPSLPMLVYSQQVLSGMDHFVLLAIPFFVLAGLLMEANGMSSRLIELLLRMMGRVRGGLSLIIITATAFFSGVSGSKLADVAAVGGIIMPAVRRTRQDPNDAAGLWLPRRSWRKPSAMHQHDHHGLRGEHFHRRTIHCRPGARCVHGIVAGARGLCVGSRIDPDAAFEQRRNMVPLVGGALVGLVMIAMIGKGVTSGIATSTEVSAFAVIYALFVGAAAFRELSLRSVLLLFMRSASMAGSILFIVAAASSVSFALTISRFRSNCRAS